MQNAVSICVNISCLILTSAIMLAAQHGSVIG